MARAQGRNALRRSAQLKARAQRKAHAANVINQRGNAKKSVIPPLVATANQVYAELEREDKKGDGLRALGRMTLMQLRRSEAREARIRRTFGGIRKRIAVLSKQARQMEGLEQRLLASASLNAQQGMSSKVNMQAAAHQLWRPRRRR